MSMFETVKKVKDRILPCLILRVKGKESLEFTIQQKCSVTTGEPLSESQPYMITDPCLVQELVEKSIPPYLVECLFTVK